MGVDEIIEHGTNGFFMGENDPVELAEYLENLYRNPDNWVAFSKAARAKAESKYRWESFVLKLLQVSIGNRA